MKPVYVWRTLLITLAIGASTSTGRAQEDFAFTPVDDLFGDALPPATVPVVPDAASDDPSFSQRHVLAADFPNYVVVIVHPRLS